MSLDVAAGAGRNKVPQALKGHDGGDVRTHRYRITVNGELGKLAQQAFEDFEIEFDGLHTSLTGNLDQAALFGALNRVQSLGLELLEVTPVPAT